MGGFSPKQKDFLNNATSRWNIKSGATRSGKTFLDYYVIPKRIRSVAGKDGLTVLLGNTKGTLQRNIIEPLQNIWGTDLVGDIKSDNTATLFGEKVYCLGADKVTQVNRIRGASIKYCYGDEVVTWNQEVFEMLKSRLDKPYSRFDGTCNPEGQNHWFKKFLDSDADIYLQNYTIDDNPFLPTNFVEALKKEYKGTIYYDRYILGLWKNAEGIIYRQFADDTEKYLVDDIGNDVDFVSIGIDFGGNRSLTTFVATAFHRNFRKITILKDYHIKGVKGDIDSDRVNKEFIGFVQQLQTEYPNLYIKYVFADSEAQYLINGLIKACRNAGFSFSIGDSAKKQITQRIFCTSTLLNTNRLYVHRRCELVIAGMQQAVWDKKSAEQGKDVRLDNFSTDIDILDATEYTYERFMNRLVPGIEG